MVDSFFLFFTRWNLPLSSHTDSQREECAARGQVHEAWRGQKWDVGVSQHTKWNLTPYIVHFFWPGFWSKVVHYVGNNVLFEPNPYTARPLCSTKRTQTSTTIMECLHITLSSTNEETLAPSVSVLNALQIQSFSIHRQRMEHLHLCTPLLQPKWNVCTFFLPQTRNIPKSIMTKPHFMVH